jgi:hypothetical protein
MHHAVLEVSDQNVASWLSNELIVFIYVSTRRMAPVKEILLNALSRQRAHRLPPSTSSGQILYIKPTTRSTKGLPKLHRTRALDGRLESHLQHRKAWGLTLLVFALRYRVWQMPRFFNYRRTEIHHLGVQVQQGKLQADE